MLQIWAIALSVNTADLNSAHPKKSWVLFDTSKKIGDEEDGRDLKRYSARKPSNSNN